MVKMLSEQRKRGEKRSRRKKTVALNLSYERVVRKENALPVDKQDVLYDYRVG